MTTTDPVQIPWLTHLDEAVLQAGESGKPLYIHFFSPY